MNSNATEARVVWLGAADGLVQVRAAIAKLATMPEPVARKVTERLAPCQSPPLIVAALDPNNGPVNNRAARRARQLGRALR